MDVKEHLKRNKEKYYLAAGIVIGFVSLKIVQHVGPSFVINNQPIFNNTPVHQVNLGGYTHKIVECLENGMLFKTVKDASEFAGVDRSMMSKHINGHMDDINDLHYRIVGVGTL